MLAEALGTPGQRSAGQLPWLCEHRSVGHLAVGSPAWSQLRPLCGGRGPPAQACQPYRQQACPQFPHHWGLSALEQEGLGSGTCTPVGGE